jgi:hypothetical protein
MKRGASNKIPKNKRQNFAMERVDIPTTQEISHVEITNEGNAHHFFHINGIFDFEFVTQDRSTELK